MIKIAMEMVPNELIRLLTDVEACPKYTGQYLQFHHEGQEH